jgi:hypothetical protein
MQIKMHQAANSVTVKYVQYPNYNVLKYAQAKLQLRVPAALKLHFWTSYKKTVASRDDNDYSKSRFEQGF